MTLETIITENALVLAFTVKLVLGVTGLFIVMYFLSRIAQTSENESSIEDIQEDLYEGSWYSSPSYSHDLTFEERINRLEQETGIQEEEGEDDE